MGSQRWVVLGASFFITNAMIAFALAMDAFSVSLANGLNFPCLDKLKALKIAAVFGFCQFLMPLIGWFLVSRMVETFTKIEPFIPWIAFALLAYIGVSMLLEARKECECEEKSEKGLGFSILLMQGIATSIDALSVGFTISDYDFKAAIVASALIGIITLELCFAGVGIGKRFGTRISGKASMLGGLILIIIGTRILILSLA